jgi:C4-dicarboxylate-specific signal transduction histidine kinase
LNNVLIEQKIKSIGQLNIEQTHESAQIFTNNELFVKMLGTRTRVLEYLLNKTEAKRTELLGIFSDYASDDKKYLSIYLLDKEGNTLISTDPRLSGQNYSFRDYFKKGLKGEHFVDHFLGKTTNEFGYYFSYPVINKNKDVLGVMVVKVDVKEINNSLMYSEAAKESTVMLTDENGVIIYSNKEKRFLKSLGELSDIEKEKISKTDKYLGKEILPIQYTEAQELVRNYKAPTTIKIYDEKESEDEIISVSRINNLPFFLVTEIGIESITGTVINITIMLIVLILIGLIAMILIIFKTVTRIISPLNKLKVFSKEISDGNFNKKIDVGQNDEFSELAGSFNIMASKLADLYNNLDNKVRERTEELSKKEIELKNNLSESERTNKLMVGRELEMIKLKKEIEELKSSKKAL